MYHDDIDLKSRDEVVEILIDNGYELDELKDKREETLKNMLRKLEKEQEADMYPNERDEDSEPWA